MNRFRRYDVVEHSPFHTFSKSSSTLFTHNTTMLNPYYLPTIEDEIDLLSFAPLSFYDEFDAITDLIQIHDPPLLTSHRHVTRFGSDHHLHALCDRVSALELLREERLMRRNRTTMIGDRNYAWTVEINSPERERKYKVTTEVKDSRRSRKWTAEIKGRGVGEYCYPVERTYRIKVGDSDSESDWEEERIRRRKGKGKLTAGRRDRIVEIEESSDHHRAGVFRQVGVNYVK